MRYDDKALVTSDTLSELRARLSSERDRLPQDSSGYRRLSKKMSILNEASLMVLMDEGVS